MESKNYCEHPAFALTKVVKSDGSKKNTCLKCGLTYYTRRAGK